MGVRKAYRRVAALSHPDSPTPDAELYQEVQDAYNLLTEGRMTLAQVKKETFLKAKEERRKVREAKKEAKAAEKDRINTTNLLLVLVSVAGLKFASDRFTDVAKDVDMSGPPPVFFPKPSGPATELPEEYLDQ